MSGGDFNARVRCLSCGDHRVSDTAMAELKNISDEDRSRLAHAIVKMPSGALVTSILMRDLLEATKLPPALERIDNLVQHLALNFEPGQSTQESSKVLWARLGCERSESAVWVLKQAEKQGYVGTDLGGRARFLSAKGWQRHAELMRNGAGSTHAFMAMGYGDTELQSVFSDHFVPAVAATGFSLRKANDPHQPAGSIDDTMRVDIRTSRFVVCDLTHGNRGAYWEAGFAEGIGRPVIYVCKADVLSNEEHTAHPHFDTRQQLIVPWDLADMTPTVRKLKAAIRATLPGEAKMEDG
jgi:hypothetical protein